MWHACQFRELTTARKKGTSTAPELFLKWQSGKTRAKLYNWVCSSLLVGLYVICYGCTFYIRVQTLIWFIASMLAEALLSNIQCCYIQFGWYGLAADHNWWGKASYTMGHYVHVQLCIIGVCCSHGSTNSPMRTYQVSLFFHHQSVLPHKVADIHRKYYSLFSNKAQSF